MAGIENRGTSFGGTGLGRTFTFAEAEQELAETFRFDTRYRTLNADSKVSTFNARDTSHTHEGGSHPYGAYRSNRKGNLAALMAWNEMQIQSVKGGKIRDLVRNYREGENSRKFGSLPRNESTGCNLTVKMDDRKWYCGADANHFGGNCGTANRKMYHDEQNLRERDPGAYSHIARYSESGYTRQFSVNGPDAISFAKNGRARYDHDGKQKGLSKLGSKYNLSFGKDYKAYANDLRGTNVRHY